MDQFDKSKFVRHMALLGRDVTQTILQTWPDKKTKRGYAHTGTDRTKLREASSVGSNAGFALVKFPEGTFNGHVTRSVDFIREKDGFYDVLAAEWDDSSSLEDQLERISEAQLPEPSLTVFTGGKSHHHYWLLDESISMEEFCDHQARLAQALGSDDTITTGDQVMRLAGFPHSGTGEVACVVRPAHGDTAARYSLDEFSALPAIPAETPQPTANTAAASDLTAAIQKFLFPIAEQFSGYDAWLRTGMAFNSLGDGHLALWVDFCRGMEGFDEAECLAKWQTFKAKQGGVGVGSVYYWLAREGWRGGDQIKAQHPIAVRIQLLVEGLLEITRVVTSAWKRRAHADDLNEALGKPAKGGSLDAALTEAISAIRQEKSKTPRRATGWEAFVSEAQESAVVDWIVYGVIAKGDSHLLVAPAKEGKTSTLAALLASAWFGPSQPSQETPQSLIWYSDDQDRKKTQNYLLAAAKGVCPDGQALLKSRFENGQLIVDDRCNLTPDGIEELIDEVRNADSPVVVIDSLASVCRKLGLKENDSSFANVIYDLGEAVKEANPDATLVIIHHATKGGTIEKGALESVRGSGAIVGAVDNVINISKPLKTSRGGNSAVADDDTTEREIHINGRIPGGKYFIDLEFRMATQDNPEMPGKVHEKLDTITATFKAESNHQEASEASLGSCQEAVLNHLQTYADQEWTTKLIAADLDKDQGQISRALAKLLAISKVVKRREGREVFYQAIASLERKNL